MVNCHSFVVQKHFGIFSVQVVSSNSYVTRTTKQSWSSIYYPFCICQEWEVISVAFPQKGDLHILLSSGLGSAKKVIRSFSIRPESICTY